MKKNIIGQFACRLKHTVRFKAGYLGAVNPYPINQQSPFSNERALLMLA
jgi:hypothetical protein